MLCAARHVRHLRCAMATCFRIAAQLGCRTSIAEHMDGDPDSIPERGSSRAGSSDGAVVHVPDALEPTRNIDWRAAQQIGGFRAHLGVPLLRDGESIGVFVLGRPSRGPFAPRRSNCVQTFADQAVIAIENVRLFDEVQARTAN